MGFWNFNFRLHPRLGPLKANVTRRGWRSTSAVWGWLTWNFKYRRLTIDWPGPGSISHTFGGRARRNRTRR